MPEQVREMIFLDGCHFLMIFFLNLTELKKLQNI